MIFSTEARCTSIGFIGWCAFAFACSPVALMADDGQPVAIRHWDGGGFTIETMWGFQVELGAKLSNKQVLPRESDLKTSDVSPSKSKTLQRLPNQAKLSILDERPTTNDENLVVISHGEKNLASVAVDGLTIVYMNDAPLADQLQEIASSSLDEATADMQLVVVATGQHFDEQACVAIYDMLKPRLLVVNANVKKVGDQNVEAVSHNTVAVSHTKQKEPATRIVSLGTKPYEMAQELAGLFAKKEAACEKSQSVFAKLSVDQMNFKPANGTHTPRWNTEHMMGRELGFFSKMYHAVDPEIPVMNLNPAQMPDKYKFAHPDWTGEEEARQMARVEAFTRRFAYLLDGMDLNARPKGSRSWSPKKLLMTMERHYKEHTDNVIDKMKLEGWPKE